MPPLCGADSSSLQHIFLLDGRTPHFPVIEHAKKDADNYERSSAYKQQIASWTGLAVTTACNLSRITTSAASLCVMFYLNEYFTFVTPPPPGSWSPGPYSPTWPNTELALSVVYCLDCNHQFGLGENFVVVFLMRNVAQKCKLSEKICTASFGEFFFGLFHDFLDQHFFAIFGGGSQVDRHPA